MSGFKQQEDMNFEQQMILHQLHLQQQQQYSNNDFTGNIIFPHNHEDAAMFPWVHQSEPYLNQTLPPYNRTTAASLFQYGQPSSSSVDRNLMLITEALGGPVIQPVSSSGFLGIQGDLGKMTAQEIMDAKAQAASKSHSEAERRRRERINNHLAKLRTLLPNTSKTDKASLLEEVIQHVKELKRQTNLLEESSLVPTETDELTVNTAEEGDEGKRVIKASLCCDDRSDLLPELIKALKALRLRTVKAEITTLGGRAKNVLFLTGEEEIEEEDEDVIEEQCLINMIHGALKGIMERTVSSDDHISTSANVTTTTTSGASIKRQKTNINIQN